MIQNRFFQRDYCKATIFGLLLVVALPSVCLRANGADTPAPSVAKLKPASVKGKWQYAWDVRGGTVRGIMDLKQKGNQVTGTFFEEIIGQTFSLSGYLQGKDITFDVPFPGGSRPYTIEFKGMVDRDKMTGTSAMKGPGQVFLGHGGEVVEPERPWTAMKGLKHKLEHAGKPPKEEDEDD